MWLTLTFSLWLVGCIFRRAGPGQLLSRVSDGLGKDYVLLGTELHRFGQRPAVQIVDDGSQSLRCAIQIHVLADAARVEVGVDGFHLGLGLGQPGEIGNIDQSQGSLPGEILTAGFTPEILAQHGSQLRVRWVVNVETFGQSNVDIDFLRIHRRGRCSLAGFCSIDAEPSPKQIGQYLRG